MTDVEAVRFRVTMGDGVLRVVGDLDVSTAGLLRLVLQPFAGRRATVDFSEVTFVDSTGIQALLAARRVDTVLRIINVPQPVRRVFELSAIADELGVEAVAPPANPDPGFSLP